MAVAHRMGLDVPRDLTVVGFDDTALATTVWPALTTVRQPIAEMAREAVKLVLEQIRRKRAGAEQQPVQKLLEFTLIPRESTGRVNTGAALTHRSSLPSLDRTPWLRCW